MGLILTYDDELYKEPDNSYGEKTKIVRIIPKYDCKDLSYQKPIYKDEDEFEIGDIVKLDTDEKLIFVYKNKRFAYLCSMDSIDEFKGTIKVPLGRLEKRKGSLSEYFTTKLLLNIKDAFYDNSCIAKEIEEKIETLIKWNKICYTK